MNEQSHTNKNRLLFSGAIFAILLILLAYANIVSRWGSFDGLLIFPIAFIVWMVWIVHLGWMLSKRTSISKKRKHFWAVLFSCAFVSVITAKAVCQLGVILRVHEIQTSVDAGLREDCLKLLLNWPVKDDRIYNLDPKFSRLPSSIKIFAPVYVINDNIDDTNIPPNIGLCKNGFGGFALGIRVFRSDKDADKFITYMKTTSQIDRDFGCQRVAPGVYYWWRDT